MEEVDLHRCPTTGKRMRCSSRWTRARLPAKSPVRPECGAAPAMFRRVPRRCFRGIVAAPLYAQAGVVAPSHARCRGCRSRTRFQNLKTLRADRLNDRPRPRSGSS